MPVSKMTSQERDDFFGAGLIFFGVQGTLHAPNRTDLPVVIEHLDIDLGHPSETLSGGSLKKLKSNRKPPRGRAAL